MDFRQLRYFASIVDCGSLSKAAEQLRIAQPSLSQHVLNLETELEVQLLKRTSRGVTATLAGQKLVRHAKEIMLTLEHIKRDVRETAAGLTGSIVLGMTEKYSMVLTVPIVEQFEKELPNIEIRIIANMSGNLLEWLLNGKIDIAILHQEQRTSKLVIEPFVSEDLYLVGRSDNALNNLSEIPFQDITGLPLVLPSNEHGLRILVEGTATLKNVQLSVKSEIDSISAIKSLLRVSESYTLLTSTACKKEREKGDLWAALIVNPSITQSTVLAYRHRSDVAPLVTRVRNLIVDVSRTLIQDGAWPEAKFSDSANA